MKGSEYKCTGNFVCKFFWKPSYYELLCLRLPDKLLMWQIVKSFFNSFFEKWKQVRMLLSWWPKPCLKIKRQFWVFHDGHNKLLRWSWINKGILRFFSVICTGFGQRRNVVRSERSRSFHCWLCGTPNPPRPQTHHHPPLQHPTPHPTLLYKWSTADLLRMACSQRITALSQQDQDKLLQLSHSAV